MLRSIYISQTYLQPINISDVYILVTLIVFNLTKTFKLQPTNPEIRLVIYVFLINYS